MRPYHPGVCRANRFSEKFVTGNLLSKFGESTLHVRHSAAGRGVGQKPSRKHRPDLEHRVTVGQQPADERAGAQRRPEIGGGRPGRSVWPHRHFVTGKSLRLRRRRTSAAPCGGNPSGGEPERKQPEAPVNSGIRCMSAPSRFSPQDGGGPAALIFRVQGPGAVAPRRAAAPPTARRRISRNQVAAALSRPSRPARSGLRVSARA